MPRDDFKTISDDLLHVAADVEAYYAEQGYEIEIEGRALGYPFTPALVAKRGHETIIVEVMEAIDKRRVERWTRFGMSQSSDTRLCLVCRRTEAVPAQEIAYAHEFRIGLLVHNDIEIMELRAPSDLAVHVALPDLKDLPTGVRKLLAGPFKKFQGDWRDGLGDAYDEVEQLSREYLKAEIDAGRAVIDKIGRGGVVTGQVTSEEVDGKTLGQLKNLFKNIKSKNYTDSVIEETLELINSTRNGLTHKKKTQKVEADLRQQAGGHLYAVISCLEELTS